MFIPSQRTISAIWIKRIVTALLLLLVLMLLARMVLPSLVFTQAAQPPAPQEGERHIAIYATPWEGDCLWRVVIQKFTQNKWEDYASLTPHRTPGACLDNPQLETDVTNSLSVFKSLGPAVGAAIIQYLRSHG